MSKDESFLMVSLKENKAKELAQVISNDSCRRILDFLAKKDASESELSKELNIPISTVHYNLSHLTKAKLVHVDEFHYSKKGKEINHYKLSNKIIIIAPKQSSLDSFKDQFKAFFPAFLVVLFMAAFLQFLLPGASIGDELYESNAGLAPKAMRANIMADEATEEALPMAAQLVKDVDLVNTEKSREENLVQSSSEPTDVPNFEPVNEFTTSNHKMQLEKPGFNIWLFLLSSVFGMAVYSLFQLYFRKRSA